MPDWLVTGVLWFVAFALAFLTMTMISIERRLRYLERQQETLAKWLASYDAALWAVRETQSKPSDRERFAQQVQDF